MKPYKYNRPIWCVEGSERDTEIRFLLTALSELATEKGETFVLDVGFAGSGYIEKILELRNITYTGLDTSAARISGNALRMPRSSSSSYSREKWRSVLSRIECIEADIINYTSPVLYDVVMSVSVIEHIVANEYDYSYSFDLYRDIQAVDNMKKLVKDAGYLLLTFPCGQERILSPKETLADELKGTPLEGRYVKHRHTYLIYNEDRIKKIKGSWRVITEQYWINVNHGFMLSDAKTVLDVEYTSSVPNIMSLCLLLLQKEQ